METPVGTFVAIKALTWVRLPYSILVLMWLLLTPSMTLFWLSYITSQRCDVGHFPVFHIFLTVFIMLRYTLSVKTRWRCLYPLYLGFDDFVQWGEKSLLTLFVGNFSNWGRCLKVLCHAATTTADNSERGFSTNRTKFIRERRTHFCHCSSSYSSQCLIYWWTAASTAWEYPGHTHTHTQVKR